jgi:hypothetical protein
MHFSQASSTGADAKQTDPLSHRFPFLSFVNNGRLPRQAQDKHERRERERESGDVSDRKPEEKQSF